MDYDFENAERKVSEFYNNKGWKNSNSSDFLDAVIFEDLRQCAKSYLRKCRLKILKFIPVSGDYILDMASGPIQYNEYLKYSENFKLRYCVDLSKDALKIAESKIRNKGKYLHGSFFDLNIENNFFDCSLSLHTIYHIHKNSQEEAVRKIIKVTKKNAPIIIIYENPHSLERIISYPINVIKKILSSLIKKNKQNDIYFWVHNMDWWKRFSDETNFKIYPWRTFSGKAQKILFPNNLLGKYMFNILWYFENLQPSIIKYISRYTMIVLYKK